MRHPCVKAFRSADESPTECIRREVKEELGLGIQPGPVLCIDWVPPHGPWDDLLAFAFDGGVLSGERVPDIRLLDGELDHYEFCDEQQAAERLSQRAWRRLGVCLDAARADRITYLEDGLECRTRLPLPTGTSSATRSR